jgi:hypothetical protein
MIFSRNTEKVFNKIQHPFLIKAIKKLETEGVFLNIKKAMHNKPYSQHYAK